MAIKFCRTEFQYSKLPQMQNVKTLLHPFGNENVLYILCSHIFECSASVSRMLECQSIAAEYPNDLLQKDVPSGGHATITCTGCIRVEKVLCTNSLSQQVGQNL